MVRRRTLLLIAVFGIVPSFAAVNGASAVARARRQQLAIDWAARGSRDLAAGRPAAAAEDFRTAQEYSRDSRRYGLSLAQALLAAGRRVEARAQLLSMWTQAPGSGPVNFALGRLAAQDGDGAAAVRYYHAAIDGAWERNAAAARRDARLELARFLIAVGQPTPAQAELIVLAGDLPPDASFVTDAGALLLLAGAPARALDVLEHALELDARSARAARLAGTAAFRVADYGRAVRHLQRARRDGALDAEAASMLDTAARVLAFDPGARGISSRERVRRIVRAYDIAAAWAARCPSSDIVVDVRRQLDAARATATERALGRDPDAADRVLALVATAESAASRACPPASGEERALALVAGAPPAAP